MSFASGNIRKGEVTTGAAAAAVRDGLTPDRVISHSETVAELYTCKYDFEEYHSAEPALYYMLAATPRSGSTHLAMELWRTGLMGAPLEYLNPPFRRVVENRLLECNGIIDYWCAVRKFRTSPNGVFGHKMFASGYTHSARVYPELLPCIAPNRVLLINRSDMIAQAVSYSMAIRSGAWYSGVSDLSKPEYNPFHILLCMEMLEYQKRVLRGLFRMTGSAVYEIEYCELRDNPAHVIRGIADFMGVELVRSARLELPHMQIQRGSRSAEWVHRFRNENVAALRSAYQTLTRPDFPRRPASSNPKCNS